MKNINEATEVSPLEFLQEIFHNVPDKGNVSVLGFRADPKIQKNWKPLTAMEEIPLCIHGENNTYFNISTLLRDEKNNLKASKNSVASTHVIMVDDLGTGSGAKGTIDGLKLPPSYMVETSPGNYQAGYILKQPITDKDISTALMNGISAKAGSDEGAKNIVRWARMPGGSNTKPHVIDECGKPFKTNLYSWNPELLYTYEEIADAYGIDLSANKIKTSKKPNKQNKKGQSSKTDDPLLTWLDNNNCLTGALSDDGWAALTDCPWKDQHTGKDPQGAGYGPPNTGTDEDGHTYDAPRFNCFHEHCRDKNIHHFIDACVSKGYKPTIDELKYLLTDTLKKMAEDVVTQSGKDVGACFEEFNIAVLYNLSLKSAADWQRIRSKLKAIKDISITAVDKVIKTLETALSKNTDDEKIDQLAIARAVIDFIGKDNLFFTASTFWIWRGTGIWESVDDRGIKKEIHAVLEERFSYIDIKQPIVTGVTDITKTECYKENHKFNRFKDCINCLSGELHYTNKQWVLKPHDKSHYLTTQIPVDYDPQAKAPLFLNFLKDIFRDDNQIEEKAWLILECIGYTLLSTARFEKFIILIGYGSNGKTVLLKVLQELLGSKNVAAVQPSQFDNRFQRAHLQDKLANIVSELKDGASIDDNALKAITSGETTTVEHKFKDPFEIEPFSTCWFGTNHMPQTTDFTDGLFRRAIVIPFNRSFNEDEQDKHLKDKLINELPGILNLALRGLTRLFDNNKFIQVDEVERAKEQWRTENDQVAQFLDDYCTLSASSQCASTQVYEAYKAWAKDNCIHRKINRNQLSNRLKRFGVKQKRDKKKRYLSGIKLTP